MNVIIKIFLGHDRPVEELENLLNQINTAILEAGYGNTDFEDSYTTSVIIVQQLDQEFTEDDLLNEVRTAAVVVLPMNEGEVNE